MFPSNIITPYLIQLVQLNNLIFFFRNREKGNIKYLLGLLLIIQIISFFLTKNISKTNRPKLMGTLLFTHITYFFLRERHSQKSIGAFVSYLCLQEITTFHFSAPVWLNFSLYTLKFLIIFTQNPPLRHYEYCLLCSVIISKGVMLYVKLKQWINYIRIKNSYNSFYEGFTTLYNEPFFIINQQGQIIHKNQKAIKFLSELSDNPIVDFSDVITNEECYDKYIKKSLIEDSQTTSFYFPIILNTPENEEHKKSLKHSMLISNDISTKLYRVTGAPCLWQNTMHYLVQLSLKDGTVFFRIFENFLRNTGNNLSEIIDDFDTLGTKIQEVSKKITDKKKSAIATQNNPSLSTKLHPRTMFQLFSSTVAEIAKSINEQTAKFFDYAFWFHLSSKNQIVYEFYQTLENFYYYYVYSLYYYYLQNKFQIKNKIFLTEFISSFSDSMFIPAVMNSVNISFEVIGVDRVEISLKYIRNILFNLVMTMVSRESTEKRHLKVLIEGKTKEDFDKVCINPTDSEDHSIYAKVTLSTDSDTILMVKKANEIIEKIKKAKSIIKSRLKNCNELPLGLLVTNLLIDNLYNNRLVFTENTVSFYIICHHLPLTSMKNEEGIEDYSQIEKFYVKDRKGYITNQHFYEKIFKSLYHRDISKNDYTIFTALSRAKRQDHKNTLHTRASTGNIKAIFLKKCNEDSPLFMPLSAFHLKKTVSSYNLHNKLNLEAISKVVDLKNSQNKKKVNFSTKMRPRREFIFRAVSMGLYNGGKQDAQAAPTMEKKGNALKSKLSTVDSEEKLLKHKSTLSTLSSEEEVDENLDQDYKLFNQVGFEIDNEKTIEIIQNKTTKKTTLEPANLIRKRRHSSTTFLQKRISVSVADFRTVITQNAILYGQDSEFMQRISNGFIWLTKIHKKMKLVYLHLGKNYKELEHKINYYWNRRKAFKYIFIETFRPEIYQNIIEKVKGKSEVIFIGEKKNINLKGNFHFILVDDFCEKVREFLN